MSVVDRLNVAGDARNRTVWKEVLAHGRKQDCGLGNEYSPDGNRHCYRRCAEMSAIREVIFDTDPSPDDAVAFLAAIASPEALRVLAITTVAGNVPVALTAKNARKALELAKRTDVPRLCRRQRPADSFAGHC